MPRDDEALLDQVLADARATEPADLEWASVEDALLARIARKERPRFALEPGLGDGPLSEPKPPWAEVLAAAAAVAVVVGIGALGRAPTAVPDAPSAHISVASRVLATTEPGRRDGDALAGGSRVDPIGAPALVEHKGRARWVLAAGSRAEVLSSGDRIEIRLDAGRLDAEVEPRPTPGWFSVVVGDTRVAVRGTRFVVERDGDRVHVEVARGRVAVGPADAQGAEAERWLLHAPSEMNLDLDDSMHLAASEPGTAKSRAERSASAAPAAPSAGSTVRAMLSERPAVRNEPTMPSPEDSAELGRLVRALSACVGSSIEDAEAVTKASSSMTLLVSPAGMVDEARFDPPLPPNAVSCAEDRLHAARFVPSRDGMRLQRRVSHRRQE